MQNSARQPGEKLGPLPRSEPERYYPAYYPWGVNKRGTTNQAATIEDITGEGPGLIHGIIKGMTDFGGQLGVDWYNFKEWMRRPGRSNYAGPKPRINIYGTGTKR